MANRPSVEPFSKLLRVNLTYILIDAGHFEEAFDVAEELKDREPGYSSLRRNYFLHELRAGRIEDAVVEPVVEQRRHRGPVSTRQVGEYLVGEFDG